MDQFKKPSTSKNASFQVLHELELKRRFDQAVREFARKGQLFYVCNHCYLIFHDYAMFGLHAAFHSESNPLKCLGCGFQCTDRIMFNKHIIATKHRIC